MRWELWGFVCLCAFILNYMYVITNLTNNYKYKNIKTSLDKID